MPYPLPSLEGVGIPDCSVHPPQQKENDMAYAGKIKYQKVTLIVAYEEVADDPEWTGMDQLVYLADVADPYDTYMSVVVMEGNGEELPPPGELSEKAGTKSIGLSQVERVVKAEKPAKAKATRKKKLKPLDEMLSTFDEN